VENKEEAELKKRILSNPDDPDIMKDIMEYTGKGFIGAYEELF